MVGEWGVRSQQEGTGGSGSPFPRSRGSLLSTKQQLCPPGPPSLSQPDCCPGPEPPPPPLAAACPLGPGPCCLRPWAGKSQAGRAGRGPLGCAGRARGQAGPLQATCQVCGWAIVSQSGPSKAGTIRARTEAPGRGHQSPPCGGRPGPSSPSAAPVSCAKVREHSGISTCALPQPGEKPGVQGPLTWAHGPQPPAGSRSRFPGAAAARGSPRLSRTGKAGTGVGRGSLVAPSAPPTGPASLLPCWRGQRQPAGRAWEGSVGRSLDVGPPSPCPVSQSCTLLTSLA